MLSERTLCLFASFLAYQGLRAQSISSYLSALRHMQVSAGLAATPRSEWPRLQYILKGITRGQSDPKRRRLPITAGIMLRLHHICLAGSMDAFEARLLWAACCLGYFGFMRSGEFTCTDLTSPPSICAADIAVDSHDTPSVVKVRLRRAKTDPFGQGVSIFMGKTNTPLCPVAAILNYLVARPPGEGPLLVHSNSSPLTRDQFVRMVKHALEAAGIDSSSYSGHSFRIGAASTAAAAGVPAYFIKMLGRWESEAYHLYIRTPRETLASISQLIAAAPTGVNN